MTVGALGPGGDEGVILRRRSKSENGMSGILAKSVDMALGPITYWKPGGRTVSTLFCGGYQAVWNGNALVLGRLAGGDSELH